MDRKELLREYKDTPRPAGVYVVRNLATDTWLIGTAVDLPGVLNRQRFQLELGSHPDATLQADWNTLGPDAFEFAVLDQLDPTPDAQADTVEEVRVLGKMWLERLTESGQSLYAFSNRLA